MRAGLLKERIHLLRPITVRSETGYQETVYDSCIRTRAAVRYEGGQRQVENDETVFTNTVTFTIRRFAKFDETYRVRWNGSDWRILSVERRRMETAVRAEKIEQ